MPITRDTKAGVGIARTTTTKDLIVRVITPRFLTEGDRVTLPTIAHNYLEGAKDTSVSLAAKGLEADWTCTIRNDRQYRAVAVSVAMTGDSAPRRLAHASVTAIARTDADADAIELADSSPPLRPQARSRIERIARRAPANIRPMSSCRRLRILLLGPCSVAGAVDGRLTSWRTRLSHELSVRLHRTNDSRASSPMSSSPERSSQLKLVPTERLSVLDRQANAGLPPAGRFAA